MMPYYQLLQFRMRRFGLALMLPAALWSAVAVPTQVQPATAQTSEQNRALTINSDMQEYDSKSQVATARGNVQMLYPSRGIQATAAQAQYFSRERRIILSGNVYVLQKGGNSIRGEKVTYLIDEGRFIAEPRGNRQVESIYIVNDANVSGQVTAPAPATAPLKRAN